MVSRLRLIFKVFFFCPVKQIVINVVMAKFGSIG